MEISEIPEGAPLNKDTILVFITQARIILGDVCESIKEFKKSIEEMSDRIDASADDVRESLSGVGSLRKTVEDNSKSIAKNAEDIDKLKNWQRDIKAWLAGAAFVGGGVGMVLGFLINKLWPK